MTLRTRQRLYGMVNDSTDSSGRLHGLYARFIPLATKSRCARRFVTRDAHATEAVGTNRRGHLSHTSGVGTTNRRDTAFFSSAQRRARKRRAPHGHCRIDR
eukprot:312412-Prorocentrum_minimum.AAC.1